MKVIKLIFLVSSITFCGFSIKIAQDVILQKKNIADLPLIQCKSCITNGTTQQHSTKNQNNYHIFHQYLKTKTNLPNHMHNTDANSNKIEKINNIFEINALNENYYHATKYHSVKRNKKRQNSEEDIMHMEIAKIIHHRQKNTNPEQMQLAKNNANNHNAKNKNNTKAVRT